MSEIIDDDKMTNLVIKDVEALIEAEKSYGDSWKRRGGVGAFMMLARKWDRIENQVKKINYDIFKSLEDDKRDEGIIDDVRDLRRYLILVEYEMTHGDQYGCTATTQDKKSEGW